MGFLSSVLKKYKNVRGCLGAKDGSASRNEEDQAMNYNTFR